MDSKQVAQLFQNEKFRNISILFFNQPRSVTEVEKLSRVSRTTIYNFFDSFKVEAAPASRFSEIYDKKYIQVAPVIGEKAYQFEPLLMIDWITEHIKLNEKEKEALSIFVNDPSINMALKKQSSWDKVKEFLARVMFEITLLGSTSRKERREVSRMIKKIAKPERGPNDIPPEVAATLSVSVLMANNNLLLQTIADKWSQSDWAPIVLMPPELRKLRERASRF